MAGSELVRGEADEGASAEDVMLGVEPATDDRPGGWPYLIRQDRPVEPGGSLLHVATGIQRLADAKLMVAAPELAEALLRLLTSRVAGVVPFDKAELLRSSPPHPVRSRPLAPPTMPLATPPPAPRAAARAADESDPAGRHPSRLTAPGTPPADWADAGSERRISAAVDQWG